MPDLYRGLIVATPTPFTASGEFNPAAVPPLIEHYQRTGITGLYVCGSTGEGHLLTAAERREVAAAFIKAAAGKIPVIVHVGHDSLHEARGLAEHAQGLGAQAVAATSPTYFKPGSVESLAQSCAFIAGGAPRLPFFYYHIPSKNGVGLDMVAFLKRAGQLIPRLAGLKFTHENLMEYQECLELEDGRYQVLFGRDEMLLAALATGAKGAVGSTYNYSAPFYHQLWAAFERGDLAEARRWQSLAIALIRVLIRLGGIAGNKAIMNAMGLNVGPARLPQLMPADKPESIRAELVAGGLLKPDGSYAV